MCILESSIAREDDTIEKLEGGVKFDGHPTNEHAPLHKRLF